MMDIFYFFVLVLNSTSLFSFVAPQLGVSIGDVSLVLFGVNVVYLFVRFKHSAAILYRGGMGKWLLIMVLWPFFTLLYSPSLDIREIGLRLYCFSLFFGSVVYSVVKGLPAMRRMFALSLVITFIGMALSVARPGYFEAVALISNGDVDQMGRPFGFFMEPNRLAHSLFFLFMAWFALWKKRDILKEVLALLMFLLAMLSTGSRTGMLIAVLLIALIFAPSPGFALDRKRVMKLTLFAVCCFVGLIGANYYLSNIGNTGERRQFDLVDRMKTLLQFKLTTEARVVDDTSVRARLDAQKEYMRYIMEHPIAGNGFGMAANLYQTGKIYKTAHSEALTRAMEYGVLYPIAFVLLMIHFCLKAGGRIAEKSFGTNSVIQFGVIVVLLFIGNGDLFDNRTFYIVWGMLFASVHFPQNAFGEFRKADAVCDEVDREPAIVPFPSPVNADVDV
jgi:hypothetical protein